MPSAEQRKKSIGGLASIRSLLGFGPSQMLFYVVIVNPKMRFIVSSGSIAHHDGLGRLVWNIELFCNGIGNRPALLHLHKIGTYGTYLFGLPTPFKSVKCCAADRTSSTMFKNENRVFYGAGRGLLKLVEVVQSNSLFLA